MTKEEKLVNLLAERGYHIVFAESCTAGLAAARLVNVPSASSVLDVSFITYANEAKVQELGVKAETIEKYGVVSEEVAGEMAYGAARVGRLIRSKMPVDEVDAGDSDAIVTDVIGVGISGIAGPSGGSLEKPVGTVSFGIYMGGKTFTWLMHFGDIGRNAVREASVDFIYDKLLQLLMQD